jgi:hypothetical protein
MPQNYEVEYSTDNINFTALSNVQEINISVGRQQQLAAYNAASVTITARYPSGFASPITALTSGNFIAINNLTSGQFMFLGVINNVDVSYGIPYAGGVGNADYITISVEGSFSRLGRVQGQSYAMAAGTLYAQIVEAQTASGVAVQTVSTNTQLLAGTTVSGSWGDWVNSVLVTINGRMWDSQAAGITTIRTPFQLTTSPITFSDTTNNATNQVYDQINFGSYADNYYTQVTVDPEGFAPQTVQTGSAPYRTLNMNTFSASTAQATDYANYLLNNYKTQGFALLSISCLAEAQNTFKLDAVSGEVANHLCTIPGTRVSVVFRGTTFNCVIEGATVTATPESSRYTFYLSGADLNAYLILDNTVFGKLNNNKLGY